MWSFNKKDREKDKEKGIKGIIIPAGGELQLPLPPTRFDRDKCFMRINGKEELLEESGLIAEIKVDNAAPIRIKIFPDFKNRRLEAIEIIDAEDNKEYPKDGPRIQFAGISSTSMDTHIENIRRYTDMIEENIIESNRKYRRKSYILIITSSIVVIFQLYIAYIGIGMMRYINLILVMVGIAAIYISMATIGRINKIDRDIKANRNTNNEKDNIIKSSEMKMADTVKEK